MIGLYSTWGTYIQRGLLQHVMLVIRNGQGFSEYMVDGEGLYWEVYSNNGLLTEREVTEVCTVKYQTEVF